MILRSINPYTNEVIKEFDEISDDQAEEILSKSAETFKLWKETDFKTRRSFMEKAGAILREYISEYAGTITSEMGKPIRESRQEIEKCAWTCEYYAQNAERFLMSEPVETDANESYVRFEPLGTVLGIMPWNFPFWQVFRFAVPTIMAGNSVLLKHASNVQVCAQKIGEIFSLAGFPHFLFSNLVLGPDRVEKIIKHEKVMAVSLTGSEFAGEKVAEAAGSVLKKALLELGGSNAFIVLEDANIEKAVGIGIKARYQNAGQSCIAAKRFIVHKNVSKRFINRFLEEAEKIKTGDPSRDETEMGPLASIIQADKLEEQVRYSVRMGARLIAGGKRERAFFEPSVAVDVTPGMPLFDEEVFGPVAPITIAGSTEEAVSLAGNTNFGLGVSLFTEDLNKANDLVKEFRDGAVFVNGLVKSDPRLPFGGTRRSGYGRELAVQGIREFVNVKTVWIKKLST